MTAGFSSVQEVRLKPFHLFRHAVVQALVIGCALGAFSFASGASAQSKDVVVFAAASLKNALDEAAAAWTRETGKTAKISYAGSNALAKQIEEGAPADIFFSADLDWMNELASKNLLKTDTRANLLGNTIVLVAPKDSESQVAIKQGFDLAGLLGSRRLAMGSVDAVPAGKYGKAALEKLGAWDGVKDKVAQADNVRAALLLVSRGEAPFGIVYRTDAAAEPGVKVVGTFPEGSYPPVIYPVALTKNSANADAQALLAFLRSDKAKPFFEKQGFDFVNNPPSAS